MQIFTKLKIREGFSMMFVFLSFKVSYSCIIDFSQSFISSTLATEINSTNGY